MVGLMYFSRKCRHLLPCFISKKSQNRPRIDLVILFGFFSPSRLDPVQKHFCSLEGDDFFYPPIPIQQIKFYTAIAILPRFIMADVPTNDIPLSHQSRNSQLRPAMLRIMSRHSLIHFVCHLSDEVTHNISHGNLELYQRLPRGYFPEQYAIQVQI